MEPEHVEDKTELRHAQPSPHSIMNTPSESEKKLQLGMAALKAGEKDKARALFMAVIDNDENNEQAWLWLSGAVDNDEDKQVCLENVLTLNPNNQAARRGLDKLTHSSPPNQQTIRREITPPNLAGAILYPERHTQEWEWHDPTPDRQVIGTPEVVQESSYNDLWERDNEICAFCAQELTGDELKCPRCEQQLVVKTYRYPQPDMNLNILWIMLVGISQLYMLQAIYNYLVTRSILTILLPAFLMIVFLGLTAGVYTRKYWAYLSAIVLLITILFITVIGMLIPAELTQNAMVQVTPVIDNVVNPAINLLGTALRGFQTLAIFIAVFIAVLKAGPDFERVETRRIAKLKKGLKSASSYHGAAQRAAKRGEWATAVLHWQRAAAKAPANRQFQRQLGIAYARLGFYQRSADVLQSALRLTPDPEQQAQINRLLTTVQKHLGNEQTNDQQ